MIWSIEEYQGIFAINRGLVDQLNLYLDGREARLGMAIIDSIHAGSLPPRLEPSSTASLRVHEAVEEFGKKIHQLKHSQPGDIHPGDWKISSEQVNKAVWEYVEILEGCVTELFQHLDQISFEHWNTDLSQSVGFIKDTLAHRLEDIHWGVKRLDYYLKDYRWICEDGRKKWKFWRKSAMALQKLIDRSLSSHITKTQEQLGVQYQNFKEKFVGYLQLYKSAESKVQKFYEYKAFTSLDLDTQEKLRKTDLLLELWELNSSAKTLPQYETVWALRSSMSPYGVFTLFQEYFEAIRATIFEKSRLIKKKFQFFFQEKEGRLLLANTLANYRTELEKLRSMIVHYREFLQKTEHGFSPGSKESKNFTALVENVLKLDAICEKFHYSLEQESVAEPKFSVHTDQAIQRHLHEMAQPLATKGTMLSEAEEALKLLDGLNEISSFNPYVVDYVGNSLSKAMKADWKYHVLQEIPLFQQLYEIHQHIVESSEDRQHTNRMNKFRRIVDHLELWVKNGEILKHTQEIELDINDMKGYLQDFLAKIQRMTQESSLERDEAMKNISSANQKLLEYRYLFAKFFHRLSQKNPEEKLLRKQLLFVDQYFESIDNRLQEMRKAHD